MSSGVFTGPIECVWAYGLDQKPTSGIVCLLLGDRVESQRRASRSNSPCCPSSGPTGRHAAAGA